MEELDALAKRLADTSRLGMTPELAERLRLDEDLVRGKLMAMCDGARGPVGVYLLAVYVVDDTDLFDDGEIYWWSVPALVDKKGKASWSVVSGLPAGGAPHKCGSLEWMTNLSLQDPPMLALIPAGDEEITSCVVRLGIYDDDKKPADMAGALTAGLEALTQCKREGLDGATQIVTPVREAIYRSLAAQDDDVLIDEDITLRRGDSARFNVGFVGSSINAMARAYYVVKDELRTETAGPIVLRKGEEGRLAFVSDLEPGGRVSIFARGGDVQCPVFGELTTDRPFAGKLLDAALARSLASGIVVTGSGAAKVVAFYTPP